MFWRQDPDRCRILEWVVYDINIDRPLASTSPVYEKIMMDQREDDGFSFDTSIPMTDGFVIDLDWSFRYRALARGGAFTYKEIHVNVVVCRDEVLTQINPGFISYNLWLDLPSNEQIIINPLEYF